MSKFLVNYCYLWAPVLKNNTSGTKKIAVAYFNHVVQRSTEEFRWGKGIAVIRWTNIHLKKGQAVGWITLILVLTYRNI